VHEEAVAARRGHLHPAARFEHSEVRHQLRFGAHPSTMSAREAPPQKRRSVAEIPDFSWPRWHHVCGVTYVFWSPAGRLPAHQTARGRKVIDFRPAMAKRASHK
jgi:hypothetical protein